MGRFSEDEDDIGFSTVCFERCLIGCIEEIIKDKSILLQESFRNILVKSSRDWCEFCHFFNGGNDRRYNLNRSGRDIHEIHCCCSSPIFEHDNIIKPINWNWVLGDVKWISAIVKFELQNNVFTITPPDKRYKKQPVTYVD